MSLAESPDSEADQLAERLAELIRPMRASSRFAVRAFLEAVDSEVRGASLTLYAPERAGKLCEGELSIDPRQP